MLSALLAARAQRQRRAAAATEYARQRPLHADAPLAYHMAPGEETEAARVEPDWATDY